MKLWGLAPAGHPITGKGDRSVDADALFPDGTTCFWTQSGTAALALALTAAKTLNNGSSSEVIVPAYACPDLISAVRFAGMEPVLVDLEPDRPWMSLQGIRAALSSKSVAIIAPAFLGIPERIGEIKKVLADRSVLVIEDNAQRFPDPPDQMFEGDCMICSFGRGKPVGLLGGGVLVAKQSVAKNVQTLVIEQSRWKYQFARELGYRLKKIAYHILLHPRCYWLLGFFPCLGLGQTRYKPLIDIQPIFPMIRSLVVSNVEAFLARDRGVARWIQSGLRQCEGGKMIDLAVACDVSADTVLLRYPVLLASQAHRDRVVSLLEHSRLGVTIMYGHTMPAIEGLEGQVGCVEDFPNASDFASRLITLPTHPYVRVEDVERMVDVLRALDR